MKALDQKAVRPQQTLMMQEEAQICFPQLNISCNKTIHARSIYITSALSFIAIITVILNLLVIISIFHFRQLHTTTNFLVFSLAVTDFLMGFLQLPTEILLYQSCWILSDFLCAFNFFVCPLLISVSVGNMVLISVDRYMAICDPMFYSTKVTLKRVQLCICLCWLLSALHCSWTMRDYFKQEEKYDLCSSECLYVVKLKEEFFNTAVTFVSPITVIIVLYVRVFVVAVSQARAMRSHITGVTHQRSETVKPRRSEIKAARTLGIVVIVFLLCYSPICFLTVGSINNPAWDFSATMDVWLVYCNSFLNPLIYASVYPWFRKSIKHIITLQILQPDSCEANIL